MGNLFDSDQTNELSKLMSEQQKAKLRQAIAEKLLEKKKNEEQSLNETVEPTPEEKPSRTERYVKTMRTLEESRNDNRQKVIPEKTDLLAGDESVTAGQLRQSNQELWNRVQTSLASLGGGGLGERDVIKLIQQETPPITLDSDDLAAIIPGVLDGLTTDEVDEGIVNLYHTNERVWSSITSRDGIVNLSDSTGELYINMDQLIDALGMDSGFDSIGGSSIDSEAIMALIDSAIDAALFDDSDNPIYLPVAGGFMDGDIGMGASLVGAFVDSGDSGSAGNAWTTSGGHKITNLASPDLDLDATNKVYVDEVVAASILENTDSLAEGDSNLYYLDSRARAAISSGDSYIIYSDSTGVITFADSLLYTSLDFDSDFLTKTTDSLAEGDSNLYFTDSRARAAISSADSYIVYDSKQGEISIDEDAFDQRYVNRVGDSMTGALLFTGTDNDSSTNPVARNGIVLASGNGIDMDSNGTLRTKFIETSGYLQISNNDRSLGADKPYLNFNSTGHVRYPLGVEAQQKLYYETDASAWDSTADSTTQFYGWREDSYMVMPKFYIDEVADQFVKKTGDSMSGNLDVFMQYAGMPAIRVGTQDDSATPDARVRYFVTGEGTQWFRPSAPRPSINMQMWPATRAASNNGFSITLVDSDHWYDDSLANWQQFHYDSDFIAIRRVTKYNKYAADRVGDDSYDLIHRHYLDSAISNFVEKTGDSMSGDLVMDTGTKILVDEIWNSTSGEGITFKYGSGTTAVKVGGGAVDRNNLTIYTWPARYNVNSSNEVGRNSQFDLIDVAYYDSHNALLTLGDLNDVDVDSVQTNQYLQYNGAVWTSAELEIPSSVTFRGAINAVDSAAPADPANGDMYINTGSGLADSSWTGLTTVDSDEQMIWGSDQASWFSFGGGIDVGVTEVREGVAILVADSDAARPTVSVDQSVTDTWYYSQSKVDSMLDSEHAWNVAEHAAGDSDLNARLDSEHAWNITEHGKLDSDITAIVAALDSEHAWNIAEHSALDARIDSEHAWNLAEHARLDSAIDNLDLDVDALATTDLTDVDSSGPEHGQILMYDSDAGKYSPVDIEQAGGGVAHHDSLPPELPYVNGQFWFNTSTTSLYVWHVNAWVKIGL